MKISKRYIRDMIRVALREAEEEKADDAAADEGGEDNPFAAGDDEGGEEEAGADAGGEEGGEEEEKEGGEGPKPEDLTINFNLSKVKRYNKEKFTGTGGVVKKITKDGLVVTTQPDNVDIVVNFDDITESARKFFKNKR
jgi:hypothetical protein